MGFSLLDRRTNQVVLDASFWHWRAIVEAIRSLDVLPDEIVDSLHRQWEGTGLTTEQARMVASAIRMRLLPTLADGERLLLDGSRTTVPDDGILHRDPAEQDKNYSTNRKMLELFAVCCETCDGFDVCA